MHVIPQNSLHTSQKQWFAGQKDADYPHRLPIHLLKLEEVLEHDFLISLPEHLGSNPDSVQGLYILHRYDLA